MAGEYFQKFPKIVYDNTVAINLLVRPRLKEELKKYLSNYYYYSVKNNERPDNIASNYYKMSNLSWLIFLANDAVDPLMQWYKEDSTLQEYIAAKYGSVEDAIAKTAYYRVNWVNDTTKLSPSQYDALPSSRKKYWDRAYASDQGDETYWKIEEDKRDYSKFKFYERARIDLFTETNKIIKIDYTQSSGNDSIVAGDIVRRYSSGALVASGEVVDTGTNTLKLKNIVESGNGFTANNSYTFEVRNKDNVLTVTNREVLSSSISDDVSVYWEPVSYYTYETEINDSRRTINLLDARYALQAERDLRIAMRR